MSDHLWEIPFIKLHLEDSSNDLQLYISLSWCFDGVQSIICRILLENGLMVHHWGMYLDLDTFAHLHNVLLGLGNLTIHLSMGGLKTTCTSSSFEPLWPSVLVSAGSWSSPHLLLQYIPRSSHRCRIPFHHIHSCYGPCYSILIQCCDWGCEVLPWLQLPDPLFQGLVLLF